MLEYVHPEHVEYLMDAVSVPDSLERRVGSELRVERRDDREEIVRELGAHASGDVAERLRRIWNHRSTTALQLWEVPALMDLEPAEMVERVGAFTESALEVGEEVEFDQPSVKREEPPRGPRLWRARITDELVDVWVRLYRVNAREINGEYVETPRTPKDVHVVADRKEQPRVAQVYTGKRHSRAALGQFLRAIRGNRAESGSTEAHALGFREAEFTAFAAECGLECCNLRGEDRRGVFGEVEFQGKEDERGIPEPLPDDSERRQLQEQARHSHRDYRYAFTHPDGFEETVLVRVYFHGNPHLNFRKRTSTPAMHHLIQEMYDADVIDPHGG